MDISPAPPPTRDRVRNTVVWGVGLAFVTKTGTILLSLVLARLIAPSVFGQFGTVNGLILFLMSFSMQRFMESLFYEQEASTADYHRQLTFGLVLHGGLWLIANAIAVGFLFHPVLRKVALPLHVCSYAILLNVPRIYYSTHLRRQLDWRRLRSLQIVSFVLYAASAITLAKLGFGVYALLTQNLIVPLPYVVALLFDDRSLHGLNFEWRAFRGAFRFGAIRTLSVVVNTAQQALEGLVFSTTVGFRPLGIFNRARGLSTLSTSWISDQLSNILYPSLARLPQRTAKARRAAGLVLRMSLWVSAPVAITVAMADHAAVQVLYGAQWTAATPLLRPAILAAMAGSVLSVCSLVLLSSADPRKPLALDVGLFLLNVVGLVFALPHGLLAYMVFLAIGNCSVMILVLTVMGVTGFIGGVDAGRTLAPQALTGAAAVLAARQPLFDHWQAAHPILTLAASGAACCTIMLLLVRLIDSPGLAGICTLAPGGAIFRRLLLLPSPAAPATDAP